MTAYFERGTFFFFFFHHDSVLLANVSTYTCLFDMKSILAPLETHFMKLNFCQ